MDIIETPATWLNDGLNYAVGTNPKLSPHQTASAVFSIKAAIFNIVTVLIVLDLLCLTLGFTTLFVGIVDVLAGILVRKIADSSFNKPLPDWTPSFLKNAMKPSSSLSIGNFSIFYRLKPLTVQSVANPLLVTRTLMEDTSNVPTEMG